MASLNQNLIEFEHDAFYIRYTVVDTATSLTSYAAWWGLSNNNTPFGSILLQGFSSGTGWNVAINAEGCSGAATDLDSITEDFTVIVGNYTIDVPLIYADFEQVNDGEYYHELVLIPTTAGTKYQCRAVVAATGILTVKQSLFTNYAYR